MLALKKLTGPEWRERVLGIGDPVVRLFVAGIVYWDYFGGIEARQRWPDLDDLIEQPLPKVYPPAMAIARALERVGYHPTAALRRLTAYQTYAVAKPKQRTYTGRHGAGIAALAEALKGVAV